MRHEQAKVGSCDFLDVLEEAALRRSVLEVELADGTRFSDVLLDVVTEAGRDWAVFAARARIDARDIAAVRAVR
ncbi:MAG: hypothetical protein ACK4N5_25070 [Myxococcales bacterium]